MAIKKGDKVKIEYEGRLEDGTVFDSSTHGDHSHPLEFEVGSGQIIPGFENNVLGMNKGDEKEFKIAPENAYRQHDPKLKQEIPISAIKGSGQEPKVGMVLMIRSPEGQQVPLKIIGVGKEKITLDLNHPLAGRTLIFKIKVV